jgi:hypothetical protein
MQHVVKKTVKRFWLLLLPLLMAAPSYAQEEEPPQAPPAQSAPEPAAAVQNAVLEGIQISNEPGKETGEVIVTCYFIFRDKPSSYFYEIKKKNNKLVFEFNDTQKGTSPVNSQKQPPIEGFDLEMKKVDVNKEVKGLNPEWHDQLSVNFNLTAIPQINVTDEYNVISFTYKWSTDPAKADKYVLKEGKTNWTLYGILGGITLGGGAVIALKVLKPAPTTQPPGPIPVGDLPVRVRQTTPP